MLLRPRPDPAPTPPRPAPLAGRPRAGAGQQPAGDGRTRPRRHPRHIARSGHAGATAPASGNGALGSQLIDPELQLLMEAVAAGDVDPAAAALKLRERGAGIQQVMDFAQLDAWRRQRTGFPEVLYAPGKSPAQVAAILESMAATEAVVMATRVEPQVFAEVAAAMQPALAAGLDYQEAARILVLRSGGQAKQPRLPGTVAVLSAGTADSDVAEECRCTADLMGCYAFRLADISVDGLHRMLNNLPAIRAADVVVVVSGTDGALPAVVAGLVEAPVIAVPTSVGYGAALGGIAPMLAALAASSPGVCCVNIDNGFGAAMLAARMLRSAARLRAAAAAAAVAPPPT